jgi:uncharacterized protein YunC (DUF1805 family)
MNEQAQSTTATKESTYAACPCQQIAEGVRQFLGIPAAAKQHITNSRVEFLKALRAMLDARIEQLSSQAHKGVKVAVE